MQKIGDKPKYVHLLLNNKIIIMENRPHHMGIDINRLLNKEGYKNFDHLIKCKICFNILLNPQDCEQCGNTFCKDCISHLLVNKKPCPFNCENFSIKPSSLSITSFLSSMKFSCINKELGCNSTLTYLQVPVHDKECNLALASCPNVKCKKQVRRQTLEYHIRKECEYSLFACPNCEEELQRTDFLQHVENCKIVSDVFNNVQPILNLDETNKYDQINLKDLSLGNFMKMILINIAKISQENEKKFEFIKEEVKNIKEDIYKYSSSFNSTNLILENINSEIEVLNERITHMETGFSSNDNLKKILEDNIKDNIIFRESVIEKKPNSKENSFPSTTNNSKNNSTVINVTKQGGSEINTNNIGISNINTNNTNQNHHIITTPNTSGVKKVNIKPLPKTLNRSPNKSPVNTHTRSPNQKTYNYETESYQIKTSHLTLIKTIVKNQETIIENFSKVLNRLQLNEAFLSTEVEKVSEKIKNIINDHLLEDIKCFTLETSLDNSNRIFKKIEQVCAKV